MNIEHALLRLTKLRALVACTSQLSRDGALSQGPGARAEVALTFDDGPDPQFTPRVLDAASGRVVAVMKSTGNEPSVPDGYATALADVLAWPDPAVAALLAARRELDVDAVAAARWGTLLERVGVLLQRSGCGPALA